MAHTKRIKLYIAGISLGLYMVMLFNMCCFAQDNSYFPQGEYYEFELGDDYAIDVIETGERRSIPNALGTFSVYGDISEQENKKYYVKSGNVNFKYEVDLSSLETNSSGWNLTEDYTKKVNGIKFDEDILNGAIIVQSSMDGKEWFTDTAILNVFSNTLPEAVYTTKDIQQINGCYYRVLVVYMLEKQLENSKFLFWDTENFDYKRAVEIYSFYLINQHTVDTPNVSPETTPRKEFGDVVNTGLDNGYDLSQAKAMEEDDPHLHKKLGKFVINGYTSETSATDGTPIFLKTVGDDVILWFSFDESTKSIDALFGNEDLCINDDKDSYDKQMSSSGEHANFKHGALFVKFTDEEGKSREIAYFDFLKANTRPGADTRIQLYEEGDYEVVLDYEIDNGSLFNPYNDYKIQFNFMIRNGNTMVFPRDVTSGSELKDGAWTADGFKLDLAESKYLTINTLRKEVVQNADGTISTSTRENKAAKEESEFTRNGIYEITVQNPYTEGETTVLIYVGNDKNILALAKSRMSVDELNGMIKNGYIIEDDGTITEPPKPTEPETVPVETSATVADKIAETQEQEIEGTTEESLAIVSDQESSNTSSTVPIIIGAIIAGGGVVFGLKKKEAKKEKS